MSLAVSHLLEAHTCEVSRVCSFSFGNLASTDLPMSLLASCCFFPFNWFKPVTTWNVEGRPCAAVVDRHSSPKLSTPLLLRASYTNSTVSATFTAQGEEGRGWRRRWAWHYGMGDGGREGGRVGQSDVAFLNGV